MKKMPEFNLKESVYADNPVYISKKLDPYTAKIAQFLYNKLHLTANKTTLITFFLGMAGIAIMYFYRSWWGMLFAAILITLRNIGDTADGKIARGTKTFSPLGGYSDIIADWLFFHAAFFIVLGVVTGHALLGALCVTGYMSREFARRKFTEKWGMKITETNEAKRIPLVVSLARKYDLASWFWIIPFFMIVHPLSILYITVIIEYGLLFGELIINFTILYLDNKKRWEVLRKELENPSRASKSKKKTKK